MRGKKTHFLANWYRHPALRPKGAEAARCDLITDEGLETPTAPELRHVAGLVGCCCVGSPLSALQALLPFVDSHCCFPAWQRSRREVFPVCTGKESVLPT